MQESMSDEAQRVRERWRDASTAGEDGAVLGAAIDDLLDFLRNRAFGDDPRAWGEVAVDAVAALLARHRSSGDEADQAAASRLAEVVWHIDELEPLTALGPIIRCLWRTQDLTARADVQRWANVRLLELVVDRDRERRAPMLCRPSAASSRRCEASWAMTRRPRSSTAS